MCDNWFSSVPGPTNPNRAFAHFGTSFGRVDNGPVWFAMSSIGATEQGIYGRLRDCRKSGKDLLLQPAERDDRDDVPAVVLLRALSRFREGLPEQQRCRTTRSSSRRTWDQDDGTLAADHHPDNFVLAGDQFIRYVYEAIRLVTTRCGARRCSSIVWDEHGGIFDHVSPPTLPYGDSFRSPVAGFDFNRLGARVPAIVVSPYVTPGVSHALFEHASIPATADATVHRPARHTRAVPAREACADLTAALDREHGAAHGATRLRPAPTAR